MYSYIARLLLSLIFVIEPYSSQCPVMNFSKDDHFPWEFDLTRPIPAHIPPLIYHSEPAEDVSQEINHREGSCPWESFLDDTARPTGVFSSESLISPSPFITVLQTVEVSNPTGHCVGTDSDSDDVVEMMPRTQPSQSRSQSISQCIE